MVDKLTESQIKDLSDALTYWTQYATYYTDEGFYTELFDAWSDIDIDFDTLLEVLNNGVHTSDTINQIIYDNLWTIDGYKLDRVLEVQEADYMGSHELGELVGFDVYELDDVLDGHTWWDLVDDSLKDKGLDSHLLGLVDDVVYRIDDLDALYKANAYINELTKVSYEDLFEDNGGFDLVREYIED